MSLLIVLVCLGTASGEGKWVGVDQAVVERFAEHANRPPRDPWISLEGDLPLLMFLLAGVAGGFVAGYYFRTLFPPKIGKES